MERNVLHISLLCSSLLVATPLGGMKLLKKTTEQQKYDAALSRLVFLEQQEETANEFERDILEREQRELVKCTNFMELFVKTITKITATFIQIFKR